MPWACTIALCNSCHSTTHSPIIDMSGRSCKLCGIKYEERFESNRRRWCGYEDGFICLRCVYKSRFRVKKYN